MAKFLPDNHRKAMMACLSGVDGVSDGMDDDALMSMVADDLPKLRNDHANMCAYANQLESKTANMSREIESLQGGANLSRGEPEGVIFERAQRVKLMAEPLVPIYGAAVTKEITDILVGTAEAPATMLLSREEGSSTDCPSARIMDVLRRARPAPKPGDQTASYLLSRSTDATNPGNIPGGGAQNQAGASVTRTSPYTGKPVNVPAAN